MLLVLFNINEVRAENENVTITFKDKNFFNNIRYSYDSRRYGLVDESDVYGEVILRFFPFGSFKFF